MRQASPRRPLLTRLGFIVSLVIGVLWAMETATFIWLSSLGVRFYLVHILPVWLPFLLIAIWLGRRCWPEERISPGHCQSCGYSLTGNTSGICPECGTAALQKL